MNLELYNFYKRTHKEDILDPSITPLQNTIYLGRIQEECDFSDIHYNRYDIVKDISSLKDISKASELIIEHMKKNSYIMCVVDYDSDGVNSAVVLHKALRDILNYDDKNIGVIINRRRNGNGFNRSLMNHIANINNGRHIDLIITADHGSANNDQFKTLVDLGIDLVVTDHHLIPEDNYPSSANVFINNQRDDSEYSKNVSGCCIAFLVMLNTYMMLNNTKDASAFNKLLPYVAISTITDMMPLSVPLNRHIVKTGLNEINSYRNRAFAAIKSVIGIVGKLTVKDIGFKLGPLINSANRTGCEKLAYDMLMTTDNETAFMLAVKLDEKNGLRKVVTNVIMRQMIEEIQAYPYENSIVTVIDTDLAINGIIAANVGELKHLPSISFIKPDENTEIVHGSCRRIVAGFNIFRALKDIQIEDSSIMSQFGGHDGAAGCGVYVSQLERFKELFDKHSKAQLDLIDKKHKLYYDAYVDDKDISCSLVKEIEQCGPYGSEWPEPVFVTELTLLKVVNVGNNVKFIFLKKDKSTIEAMCFFKTKVDFTSQNAKTYFTPYSKVLVAFEINLQSYMNVIQINMTVLDVKEIIKE